MLTLGRDFALDALETRADGFVAIRFGLTEPGVVEYVRAGKRVRALKDPTDWAGDSFLMSARSVAITLEHPPYQVMTPAHTKDVMGLTDSTPAFAKDARVFHGGTVTHQMLIDKLRTKEIRAVSAGTHVDWVENSGTWTAPDGSLHPYDLIQRNPRLNHVAATRSPRVPSSVIMSLDSDIAAVWIPDSDAMDELKELLAKLSLDSTAVAALTKLVSDRDAKLAELHRTTEALRGERDSFKAKFEQAPSLDSLGERVTQELQVVSAIAAKVPGVSLEALAKAKTVSERYLVALDSLKVAVDPKSSEDYLRGRFEAAVATPAQAAQPTAPATQPHPNSARAGLMAQDAAPKPLTAAQRIEAAKELNRRRSRGENI